MISNILFGRLVDEVEEISQTRSLVGLQGQTEKINTLGERMTILTEVLEEVAAFESIVQLTCEEAQIVKEQIAGRYVQDHNKLWFWESLKGQASRITYDGEDGLALISKAILGNPTLYIALTDDEFPPWPVLKGNKNDILGLISELRFFEYFLTIPPFEWVIFDNHHNQLIGVNIELENL